MCVLTDSLILTQGYSHNWLLITDSFCLSVWKGVPKIKKESLRGGKVVQNLEIFLMNTKTIIAFGFLMVWRITLISEAGIHLGR